MCNWSSAYQKVGKSDGATWRYFVPLSGQETTKARTLGFHNERFDELQRNYYNVPSVRVHVWGCLLWRSHLARLPRHSGDLFCPLSPAWRNSRRWPAAEQEFSRSSKQSKAATPEELLLTEHAKIHSAWRIFGARGKWVRVQWHREIKQQHIHCFSRLPHRQLGLAPSCSQHSSWSDCTQQAQVWCSAWSFPPSVWAYFDASEYS